mmetsp:Transcript_42185/g.127982  ORF Transcript_42185/g.127982 Transcript_42185/m.127982 type:complete len:123 (-) Transcript_42185:985-1353(-)
MERGGNCSAAAHDATTLSDELERTPRITHHNPLLRREAEKDEGTTVFENDYGRAPTVASQRRGSLQDSINSSIRSLVEETFRLPGKPCSVLEAGGVASVPNEIFNLVKNLVGAGALGLPSGV